jgi:hypothetical protein
MPNYYCDNCEKSFFIRNKDRSKVSGTNALFCSPSCFITDLRKGAPIKGLGHLLSRTSTDDVTLPDQYYSDKLGRWFRSSYEATFAEYLESTGIVYGYEDFTIRLFDYKKYTPDFSFIQFGTFVEVKGIWRSGAKKKFVEANRIGFKVMLLPFYLIAPFKKEIK